MNAVHIPRARKTIGFRFWSARAVQINDRVSLCSVDRSVYLLGAPKFSQVRTAKQHAYASTLECIAIQAQGQLRIDMHEALCTGHCSNCKDKVM
jgi:hypothetical protein